MANLIEIYRRMRLRPPRRYGFTLTRLQVLTDASVIEDLPKIMQHLVIMNPGERTLTVRHTNELSIYSRKELAKFYIHDQVYNVRRILRILSPYPGFEWTHVALMFSKEMLRIWYMDETTGEDVVFLVYV